MSGARLTAWLAAVIGTAATLVAGLAIDPASARPAPAGPPPARAAALGSAERPVIVEHWRAHSHPECQDGRPLVAAVHLALDPRADDADTGFRGSLANGRAYWSANPGKPVVVRGDNVGRTWCFWSPGTADAWLRALRRGGFTRAETQGEALRLWAVADLLAELRAGPPARRMIVLFDYEQNASPAALRPEETPEQARANKGWNDALRAYIRAALTDAEARTTMPPALAAVPADAAWDALMGSRRDYSIINSLWSGWQLEIVAATLRRMLDEAGFRDAEFILTHAVAADVPVNGDGPHRSALVRPARGQILNDLYYPLEWMTARERAGVTAAAAATAAAHRAAGAPFVPTLHGRTATDAELRDGLRFAAPDGAVGYLGTDDATLYDLAVRRVAAAVTAAVDGR